jgi:hypothetical protein
LALAAYCERRFGRKVKVAINPITNTIGTSPIRILYNNPDRFAWIIINLSNFDVYVGWTPDVGPTKGVKLDPNGGNVISLADEDLELTGYEVYARAAASNCSIYVLEVVAG